MTSANGKSCKWAEQDAHFVWLDSNRTPEQSVDPFGRYDAILALGKLRQSTNSENPFQALKDFRKEINDYCFGFLSYELKNRLENLNSKNEALVDFPELFFFQPAKIFFFDKTGLKLSYHHALGTDDTEANILALMERDLEEILAAEPTFEKGKPCEIQAGISQKQYLDHLGRIKAHIERGDIYELNYCQAYYAESVQLSPVQTYLELNSISRAPMAAMLKLGPKYLFCSSPERFCQKQKQKLISQPIKGTARRSEDRSKDEQIARQLISDPKEISENVMIVDLVRHDMSKRAIPGSVRVQELCKLYSFVQVHQLVSTIEASYSEEVDPVDLLMDLFPMGSMTGAPKISAMEIIDREEHFQRGLYSGSLGYFTPGRDFDFNVIIRSILYDRLEQRLTFAVGGAITAASVAEKEYEECQIKAKAMIQVLQGSHQDFESA